MNVSRPARQILQRLAEGELLVVTHHFFVWSGPLRQPDDEGCWLTSGEIGGEHLRCFSATVRTVRTLLQRRLIELCDPEDRTNPAHRAVTQWRAPEKESQARYRVTERGLEMLAALEEEPAEVADPA